MRGGGEGHVLFAAGEAVVEASLFEAGRGGEVVQAGAFVTSLTK